MDKVSQNRIIESLGSLRAALDRLEHETRVSRRVLLAGAATEHGRRLGLAEAAHVAYNRGRIGTAREIKALSDKASRK